MDDGWMDGWICICTFAGFGEDVQGKGDWLKGCGSGSALEWVGMDVGKRGN
ncbi:predicted protein [Sclerotinia sclerotiorum 1980 UF-70]|uniref:Uncharacterized protein n=1 Tax=Sclerotinia sclerotiorum (strain ATCC 18683 / 1980 / Ss-1) TaxID=665079 RepID=A7EJE3_SCLS1|nr:predicted protein [Sclerotinia sclerotiorum 1980 UF-70]EDO02959.1 predicted protein [Sclerotinia sclerotiorum 1980 UF-70]